MNKFRNVIGWILLGISILPVLCLLATILILCLAIVMVSTLVIACLAPALYIKPNGFKYAWNYKENDHTITIER